MIWTTYSTSAQTPDATAALDVLLQQKHYVDLERALVTNTPALPPSSRAYFQGVMANRINDVQKSVRFLEPLIPTLLTTNLVRAELALCTLADDYAKTFRYGKAASLYGQANRFASRQGKRDAVSAHHIFVALGANHECAGPARGCEGHRERDRSGCG